MKYLSLFLLLMVTAILHAQSPFNNAPVHADLDVIQFQKSYHAATVVEISGVAIAFTAAGFAEDPSAKSAFAIFGSSVALGGLIYSLISSNHKIIPARQYRYRPTAFTSR